MIKYINTLFLVLCFIVGQKLYPQSSIIPDGAFTTAAYATQGTSIHKDKVLWLTWGAQSVDDLYGKHNIDIKNGSASYAKINLGGGRYLKISAVINNLEYNSYWWGWKPVDEGGYLNSYAPGNYTGDSMDDMYNIGGVGTKNKLVNGLRNTKNAGEVRFTITAKATINDIPVRLSGMVLGDAESLAGSEGFYAQGAGQWTIVDLKKNLGKGEYFVKKTQVGEFQKIDFVKGNDNNTGAVAFMTFNESAYKEKSLEVEFDVYLRGGGLTAIALGLIPPTLDMGDAPESYGQAFHMLESYIPIYDNVPINNRVDLNSRNYQVGTLKAGVNNYLGSTPADSDLGDLFSKNAKADDISGVAGPNEEDAWPVELQRFSHKKFYKRGDKINATIKYNAFRDGYISGWIDFNQNGVFEDEERVTVFVKQAENGSVEMIWTVPDNRVIRSTYVRLRFGYNKKDVLSPGGIATGGEVEDHKIYILAPTRTNSALPTHSK